MWFNWIAAGDFSKSFYATLTSQSPRGPFQLANKQVPMVSDENHEMRYASFHRSPHMFAGIFWHGRLQSFCWRQSQWLRHIHQVHHTLIVAKIQFLSLAAWTIFTFQISHLSILTSHIAGYDTTHRISIELLDQSYTHSLMNASQRYQFCACIFFSPLVTWIFSSGFFGDSFVEAPAMFKRDKTYYGSYLRLVPFFIAVHVLWLLVCY